MQNRILFVNKKSLIALAGATLVLTFLNNVRPSQAASITTTFSSNNEQAGNMFDVTTFGRSLTVTGLNINAMQLNDPSNGVIDVYTKSGTYVGSETNPAAWNLVSATSLASANPTDTPTFVDVTDFTLPANTTTGLYVLFQGQPNSAFVPGSKTNILAYTNGSNTYSNADISLSLGTGNRGTFGTSFSSRTWDGTIYYTAVPEPSELLGILTFGLISAGYLLKRKSYKVA